MLSKIAPKLFNEKFSDKLHQLQGDLNNCFTLKQFNKILHRMEIAKHECNKIAVILT